MTGGSKAPITPIRAVLHAFTLVILTSMIPALLGVEQASDALVVRLHDLAQAVPGEPHRDALAPGSSTCVTLAITTCALPFAFTMPGVTLRTRHMFGVGFGFGFGFAIGFGFGFGFGAVVGGVSRRRDERRGVALLFAPFVSLPSPVAGRRVDVGPGLGDARREPIARSTPGPSVPRLHCSRAPPVIEQLPFTGCCVTARNVTPPGAASVDDVVRLVRAVVPHPHRVGDVRLSVDELRPAASHP